MTGSADYHEGLLAGDEARRGAGALARRIAERIAAQGGWVGFDAFMQWALYEPGLGYYARPQAPVFGHFPSGGSDFVTAPELGPSFATALAVQVAQGLRAAGAREVVEFGAGSGALAAGLLAALDAMPGLAEELGGAVQYRIVEVSGVLQARQRERLAAFGGRVQWASQWPDAIDGVVVGNEVLDAMPVRLLVSDGRQWLERGVVIAPETARVVHAPVAPGTAVGAGIGDSGAGADPALPRFVFEGRAATQALGRLAQSPVPPAGTLTELHDASLAWLRSLAQVLRRGLVLLVDYGFPQDEYDHPQRVQGTLMCHRGHAADSDPLTSVGEKDITAHVDFTAIALAAQDAGLQVAGYTSQANFLLNCGIVPLLAAAPLAQRSREQMLIAEHEMGELFKVIALSRGLPEDFDPVGFQRGDRTHRL